MPTLTAAQRQDILDTLAAERARLLDSATDLKGADETLVAEQASGENRLGGEGEGDSIAIERHLIASLSQTNQAALAEIEAALSRLEAGTYGVCDRCEGDIPAERLEVRPRTTLCVPCA